MKIILTGCPLIENNIENILKTFGLDIPLYKWGKYGSISWSFAIPFALLKTLSRGSHQISGDFPLRKESTQEDYYIHYVSNPLYTVPLLMTLEKNVENFIVDIIKKQFNADLPVEPADRYALMFLFWNKMIQIQNPDLEFKVEEPLILKKFLEEKIGMMKPPPVFNPPVLDDSLPKFWENVNETILNGLDQFCSTYGYPLVSNRITRSVKTPAPGHVSHPPGPGRNVNPFNRMARVVPIPRPTGPVPPPGMRTGIIPGLPPGGGVTINSKLVHNVYKPNNEVKDSKNTSFGISRRK